MISMDIFIAADAVRTLSAVIRIAPAKGSRGFLLGHRRGDRIYIENILPCPSPAWPSLEAFYEMDSALGKKTFGFFIRGSSLSARKALLQPFGTGKVIVEISGPAGKDTVFKAAMIDYNGRFVFRKIPVVLECPAS